MLTTAPRVGAMYLEIAGLLRFVIAVEAPTARRQERVHWRRPGAHADRIVSETFRQFAPQILREASDVAPDPAPALPHNGMPQDAPPSNTVDVVQPSTK